MSLIVSQIKYRKTKAVNFRTDQWNVNKLDDIVNKYNKTSHNQNESRWCKFKHIYGFQ